MTRPVLVVLWSLGPLVLLSLGLAPCAHAHDPYESFTLATIRANDLELNMTMAQVTALRLIDPKATIAGLTAENFANSRLYDPDFSHRFRARVGAAGKGGSRRVD